MTLINQDLTYKIRGICFDIYKNLGSLHKESVYQNSLASGLKSSGIIFEREKIIPVVYSGEKVGVYRIDFLIDNSLVLETKATQQNITAYEKQLFYYLAGTEYKLAMLVNFGAQNGVYIKRWVLSEVKKKF